MKKLVLGAMILMLLCSASVLNAEEVIRSEYTDTAGTSTQDSVKQIDNSEGFQMGTMEPDASSQETLDQMYAFVRDGKNPPIRFFDEATQEKIRQLTKGKVDVEALHLTEFMSVSIAKTTATDSGFSAEILLDVDYQPGQLVILLLGSMDEGGNLVWLPVEAEVVSLGKLHFDVSPEDTEAVTQQKQLLLVMTDRVGKRGGIVQKEEDRIPQDVPSITADDIIIIRRVYYPDKPDLETALEVSLTELTPQMQAETDKLKEYMENSENQLLGFFEQSVQDEVKLLLHGYDANQLVVYEAVALKQEGYKDTEGDVAVLIEFPTPYQPRQAVVAIAGIPSGETITWAALRTVVKENGLDVTFKQHLLAQMEGVPVMLLILSEPAVQP
ncbi:MAG: hypothetical protein QM308_06600 [Bacillota bacterium]|nr:hypothetical protein [Bacillota bacterium]